MHLGRFLHFSQKVVGVTLKTEVSRSHFNLRVEQNLVHLGTFCHFSQKVAGVTLKTEVFRSHFQFMGRVEFSAFG